MTISAEQRKRMQAGAELRRRRQLKAAVAKVKAFREWSRSGAPVKSMPEVPTSAEFRLARRHGGDQ